MPGSQIVRLGSLVLWLGAMAQAISAAQDRQDDWPRYAHDGRLTSRSSLHGNIRQPQVRWTYNTAGKELTLEIIASKGNHRLQLDCAKPMPVQEPKLTLPGPLTLDIDGTEQLHAAQVL